MLPAAATGGPSLADVMESSLQSLSGASNPLGLPPVDRAIVFVVDGLGVDALRERAGHARTLAAALTRSSIAVSGFSTTTATGLTTLTTGTLPGVHGMVGYTVLDAQRDRVVQLLTGWDEHVRPEDWQRSRTVFERATEAGIPSFAVGLERFRDSGLTNAILRGAQFRSGPDPAARVEEARAVLDAHDRALLYVYAAEVDHASHNHGRDSSRWIRAIESVDAAVASLAEGLGPRDGLLVTADHGALDVPAASHVFFDRHPDLLDGVRHIAGEPRALQLHFEPDADARQRERIVERWRAAESDRAWVVTRREAIAAGWFGPVVDPVVEPRIGDLIVAARKRIAYYDGRSASPQALAMIGQHGSLTPEETRVPLLRLGAYARR